jgi:predicted phosphodiesterase
MNDELVKKLENLSDEEVKFLLNHFHDKHLDIKKYDHKFQGKHAKFGVISDTHIGHKCFDEELFVRAFKYFQKEGVHIVYHPGDILEGMSRREGHIYELDEVGFQNQINYAEQLLGMSGNKIHLFAITGNHDDWFMKKNNAGINVGEELERRLENFHFLGRNEADVKLQDNVVMKLFHPNDGSAYAPGYKLMKLAESFGGGEKPQILLQGHYHKALYMFNRNIHMYESGTIMSQSEFMRGKKIAAHKGFWVIDAYFNNTGVERLKNTFIPKYD